MKNILVAQSGGPTVAINASLAGVIEGGMAAGCEHIYGAKNGVTGIIDKRLVELKELIKEDEAFLGTLKNTPAMFLGSCRKKLPADLSDPVYATVFEVFSEYGIDAFFYIGGNDSMDTVDRLSKYAETTGSKVRCIGIPKTIDNDLVCTDHTPGFGSAAKYIATTVMEVVFDAKIYADPSVTIVEIMGRDAGWLTAASALARTSYCDGPDLIYLPEVPFSLDHFVGDVKRCLSTKKNLVVAVSEGIRDAKGAYISASTGKLDNFGHAQLSGAGKTLEMYLKDALGIKVRSIEVNVLQRAAAHCASRTDLSEAATLGRYGVELASAGETAVMAALRRVSNEPYEVTYVSHPVCEVANAAKEVPRAWITADGNDVTEEMVTYLRPLILGEGEVIYENGLPVYV